MKTNGLKEETDKLAYQTIQINGMNDLVKQILVDNLSVEPEKYKQEVYK